jgi:hypothetical protein
MKLVTLLWKEHSEVELEKCMFGKEQVNETCAGINLYLTNIDVRIGLLTCKY